MLGGKQTAKKIQVTFSDGEWEIIQKLLIERKIGFSASDVVRSIVLSYLWMDGYIKEATSKPKKTKQDYATT